MKRYLFIICLIVAVILEGAAISRLKNQKEMYRSNLSVLTSDIDTFRTRNGELAAKVASLQITKSDYEKVLAEDASRIKALRSRNEYLEHAVRTASETEVEIKTVIRDSIVYRDRIDTVRFFHWEDLPWEYVHGEMAGDSLSMDIRHHEELDVNIFMDYKKILWWKIRVKGYNVNVVGRNPYTSDIKVSSVTIR